MSSSSNDKEVSASDKKALPLKEPEKKPSMLKRLWTKAGLSPVMVILTFKGALPPIICIAAYESDAWARQYTTLGYLAAIMSLLSMAIQPRAKFIQSMLTSLVFTCVGAALALLQIQCVVAARGGMPRTAAVGSSGSVQTPAYSSSASVVACVWLFFNIWLANVVRAFRPQLMLPVIQYSIFSMVASTYAPQFPSMAVGEQFVRRLLITFLTGFGVATGVSLFVVPMTSRKMVGAQYAGMVGLMKGIMGTHKAFMQSITGSIRGDEGADAKRDSHATSLSGLVAQLGALFGKIKLETTFARKEVAFGKLSPEDFSQLMLVFRNVMMPLIGLSTYIEIMQKLKRKARGAQPDIQLDDALAAVRLMATKEWDEVISMSHEPYQTLTTALSGGLDHATYQLEFAKRPKKAKTDLEKGADTPPSPGDPAFLTYLENELHQFHVHRENVIVRWVETKNIQLPTHFWENQDKGIPFKDIPIEAMRTKANQQQLYLVLYIEYLVHATGKAVVELVKFADSKVADGTMKRKRLINPGWRRIKKLVSGIWTENDVEDTLKDSTGGSTRVWLGDSLNQKKDPEHLPPANFYQKATDKLRIIPRFLASPESAFGFRAAVATISIGLLAFIEQTHIFFSQQRGVWAMIMTGISMSAHAGQGIFGFVARILGTVVAMAASITIWYIGYHQHAAIIPVFYIYLCFGVLFLLKNPHLAIVAIISMVTAVLIIGYELQADKIGRQAIESNGQEYYVVYILAPYRVAAVCIGLAVAFIWTYFPFPITTHATLRKDMGSTLYLIANYYSCVHTTLNAHLRMGAHVNFQDKRSPVFRLEKARRKVFGKILLMLSQLREHSGFLKFEPAIGGKFPKETYDDLTHSLRNLFDYLALISYSAAAFTTEAKSNEEESQWARDFRKFTSETRITSHELTSTLCLLAASVSNSQPLPPYMRVPRSFESTSRTEHVNPEMLSVKHVSEPCYAAFAVLEVASTLITEEICKITNKVKELVGEVDFSFHIISTSQDNVSDTDVDTLWDGAHEHPQASSDRTEGKVGDKGKRD